MLTDQQMTVLRNHLAAAQTWFERRGFVIEAGQDFERFQAALDEAGYDRFEKRNPAFDPARAVLDRDQGAWLLIRAVEDGRIGGLGAVRLLPPAASFADLLRSGRLLDERHPNQAPIVEILEPALEQIGGRLTLTGNLFVAPGLRRRDAPAHLQGFSTWLASSVRATGLRLYEPDAYLFLMAAALAERQVERQSYRITRSTSPWCRFGDLVLFGLATDPAELISGLAAEYATGVEKATMPSTRRPSLEVGQRPPR